jgi:cytoskeletal protein RodZ
VSEQSLQLDAFTTPGSLLRTAREARGLTQREAADRLNLMPNYVAIIERDDYMALRSPSFARGYVKAYGRLLGLDEKHLMAVFDQVVEIPPVQYTKRAAPRPLQLQRTGLGVFIGVSVLLVMVLALWWWEADTARQESSSVNTGMQPGLHEQWRYAGGGQ